MIEEIGRDFFMITLPMPFRLKHVHIFATVYDGRVALFDTGLNLRQTITTLERDLESIGRSISQVDRIFVTHYHADHCGIAGYIQEISGAEVQMSAIDWQRIQVNTAVPSVLEQFKEFYFRHDLPQASIRMLTKMQKMFRSATLPFTVGCCLEPDGWYDLDGRTFQAIDVPGHSRGQVCFFFPEEGFLLSGDHVLPEITPNLSPDLFAPSFRPLKSFLSSLERINGLPVKRVYPGHGDPFNDLRSRIKEIKHHHVQRTNLILQSLRDEAKTTFQVSQDIFEPDLSDFDQFLALNETYVHLLNLLEEQQIAEALTLDGKVRWSLIVHR
jgi:glyoxylase-like metal-dependent hydrolase (beta-lactamase superfamily II)